MEIRTRVAPSPTGDPHVGTAFVALINYALAKQAGGTFILRIEDTDRARSTPAAERAILESLRWLGLRWDEGPDVGGPHGPYRQSERSAIYREYVELLLAQGHAFRCFCTPERLDAMRAEQRRLGLPPAYDGHCLELTARQIAEFEAGGMPSVVRMIVPREGTVSIDDALRGPIPFDWHTVDMQILLKSDGLPTYHLANVVDDHLMGITHVARGEEWVSSAPKHVLLYRYFGWTMPKLIHLPLLRNADKSKLSKRKNPTSIAFYRRLGYLPEALLNFLGLLANSSDEGRELFSLAEFVDRFELEKISVGGPVFDVAKLDWLCGRYMRERLDPDALLERFRDWALAAADPRAIASLAQERVERLSDLAPLCGFLYSGRLDPSPQALRDGKLDDDALRRLFVHVLADIDAARDWNPAEAQASVRRTAERLERKLRDVVRPLYVALTGSPTSLPLFDSMALLGRDLCRERLRAALAALGGASAAETNRWLSEPVPV